MTKDEIRELFSRPDYPDDPSFIRQVDRLRREARHRGEDPNTIFITEADWVLMEDYFKKRREFNLAWGLFEPIELPGTPMIHTLFGMVVKVGGYVSVCRMIKVPQ